MIPMHTVLKSYAVAGQVSREEFAQIMFRDVEKLAGRFVANQEKWGDDEQFPKAVYEMVFPGIEKMLSLIHISRHRSVSTISSAAIPGTAA